MYAFYFNTCGLWGGGGLNGQGIDDFFEYAFPSLHFKYVTMQGKYLKRLICDSEMKGGVLIPCFIF